MLGDLPCVTLFGVEMRREDPNADINEKKLDLFEETLTKSAAKPEYKKLNCQNKNPKNRQKNL